MMDDIYLIDRQMYTIEEFFLNMIPECIVEDDCVVIVENKEYDIVQCNPIGMITHKDIQFYKLELAKYEI